MGISVGSLQRDIKKNRLPRPRRGEEGVSFQTKKKEPLSYRGKGSKKGPLQKPESVNWGRGTKGSCDSAHRRDLEKNSFR